MPYGNHARTDEQVQPNLIPVTLDGHGQAAHSDPVGDNCTEDPPLPVDVRTRLPGGRREKAKAVPSAADRTLSQYVADWATSSGRPRHR